MKKLYTLAFSLCASVVLNAQSVSDVSDMPSVSTVQLSELRNNGLFKAAPVVNLPSLQAVTFDTYYQRKTAWDIPVFTISGNPFIATYSHGLPGQIGVHFDNSSSVNIDRLLVNFFARNTGTTSQTFYAYIYNAGSDSLPTGSAVGTKAFWQSDIYAATYPTFDSLQYTVIPFASAVNVTGDFVAAIQIDNAAKGNTRHRIGVGNNKCLNPGDGNSENRMCVFPVPGASNVSQQWYHFNNFFNTALSTTTFNWNCEALIIPLLVGETTPLGNQELAKDAHLTFNGHYPSPANESIKINYTLGKNTDVVNLRIFDITGKTIYETNNIQQAAGKYNFNIDVAGFSAGEYFYSIKSETASLSSHFMVVR